MNTELQKKNLSLISLILRLSMGTLFLGTAIIKVKGGIDGNIAYFVSIFEKSIFPLALVKAQASIIMFVEFILAAWLFSGIKLKEAWIASGLTLISLAFGMIFVYKFDVVSDNYIYVLIACLGLFLAPYDKYRLTK
ncbi:hypothetical protein A9Q84_14260 [Halobacteriovorax marinus]|uniref:Methylamine utilisation protein MauE domain-containing protein n=1 Tax=Halobacteriovorax marinus TaxID=97084 RepID=A0A1Y5F4T3_9BACT|nr:hypothetical protein A9Q84_14260 [Halobacteriovorax marinus]